MPAPAKLKPWYRVVNPRKDLRDGVPTDAAEFAVNLDHILQERASVHEDYLKPHLFFDRTYMTRSLEDLAAGVLRRLSGIATETSAVYNMATQFGGGKTHALATLFHLARHGEVGRSWKGVNGIVVRAGITRVPKAAVAVFVGTEFDPLTGRGGENGEPVRRTPWGEVAWQLGGRKCFDIVAKHEEKGIAPAGDVLRAMLAAAEGGEKGACLILMDEMVNFASRARKLGQRDQLFDFVQNLSEEARAQERVVLCASVPKSIVTEMSPEDEEDYTRLKNLLNRLGKAVTMSADSEIAEILRRRLFEWKGLDSDAEKTCREYAEWVRENAGAVAGISAENAYERFRACYPFHPAALSVFERKWAALPTFQRTRGVLRMLALWVANSWKTEQLDVKYEPLITLGSAPLDDPQFRNAIFEQLGAGALEQPATTDIAGRSDAHAVRLDKEGTPDVRELRLHQKTATVVFFESNGGQAKAEASIGEVKGALGAPHVNLADIDHALESLTGSCYYLLVERNRYRFSTTPNVNKILTDRRAAVQTKAIDERLKKEIETAFRAGAKDVDLDRRFFPVRTNDIPDRAMLTLVVLGHDAPSEAPATQRLMESIVKECGATGRSCKSALIFATPASTGNLVTFARDVLAWEDIDDDEQTKGRLDEGQLRTLKTSLERAKRDLKSEIGRTYRQWYLLGSKGDLELIDLGAVTQGQGESITDIGLAAIRGRDLLTTTPSPNTLRKFWPPANTEWTTKGVRDAFFQSPLLPRIGKAEAVRRTIADGVTAGSLGYAQRQPSGGLHLSHRPGASLKEDEVEISEDACILRAEDAQKLIEPAKLAKLTLRPDGGKIPFGGRIDFSVSGVDQYGQAMPVSGLEWSVSGGGSIDQVGHFTAGSQAGIYSVVATAGGIEGRADVQVHAVKEEEDDEGPVDKSGQRMIRWTGHVPPQKWTNFYTKVLTRFATSPGLVLKVSFEAPAGDDAARSKAEEARAALKELGLDDGVSDH